MPTAQQGDTVRIHYTGRLEDGSVFDTSENREPLRFRLGAGEVIPGFEAAVVGMAVGERKHATIPATEGYGPHREELVFTVPRERLPENVDAAGRQVQMQSARGRVVRATVTEVNEKGAVLDANHPLAGKNLSFDIELVKIG